MTERPISLGAPTADASSPDIAFGAGELTVAFVDWHDVRRQIVFRKVLAFHWDLGESDTTTEVVDSSWLAKCAAEHGVPRDGFAHYRLGFNACGMVLDVVARCVTQP